MTKYEIVIYWSGDDESYIAEDLRRTRNMRLAFKSGFYTGGIKAGLMTVTGGRFPGGRIRVEEDAAEAKVVVVRSNNDGFRGERTSAGKVANHILDVRCSYTGMRQRRGGWIQLKFLEITVAQLLQSVCFKASSYKICCCVEPGRSDTPAVSCIIRQKSDIGFDSVLRLS